MQTSNKSSATEGLVSIIMPAYNCEQFICSAIESVKAQSYPHWELLIVDDCSTDNTAIICQTEANRERRIKLIQLPCNVGPAASRNRAIAQSNGQYIAFLDSDDLWKAEKLQLQIKSMKSQKAVFSYTSYLHIDENGTPTTTVNAPVMTSYKQMLLGSTIGCLTVVYDSIALGKRYFKDGSTSLKDSIYGKLLNKIGHEDYVLWLEILKDCEQFDSNPVLGIQTPLAHYRVRRNSFSSKKIKVALYQWIIYRRCEQLNLFQSVYYFLNYVVRGLLKHKSIRLFRHSSP